MSAEARQALADAASTVDGITVSPYFRQATKAGSGFVRMDVLNRDSSGFGYMVSWQVAILLPQDQKAAEIFIDTNSQAIFEALSDEGHVTTAQPVALVFDASSVPALIITVIREKD